MAPPHLQNLSCISHLPCLVIYTNVKKDELPWQKKLGELSTDPNDLPDDTNTVYLFALQVDRRIILIVTD